MLWWWWLAPDPHADFIPEKSSSGRSNGHPSTLDSSGKAGIVAGGDGLGRAKGWVWTGAGSGLGNWGNWGRAGNLVGYMDKKRVKKGRK